METLFQVITYPLQRIVALLFSLVISDGVTVGALLVAALLLGIVFRALIGIHLSVFNGGSHAGRRNTGTRNSGRESGSD